MAKYRDITGIYADTIKDISHNPNEWLSFLDCAAMNYKYSFSDQVLIYAQKPEAQACAEIEIWNKSLKRWVNKGSKGIALISENSGQTYLKYVFDVSDTNSRNGKNIVLWSVTKPYEEYVIEALENRYGELENKSSLASAIISTANNMVQDNLPDYLSDLMYSHENSFLEELDELNVEKICKQALSNSVAFVMLKRAGLNPREYLEIEDFAPLLNFNTYDTITRLGIATSDIAESGLREIYSTIKNVRISEINKIRTFDIDSKNDYDIDNGIESAERSDLDERNNLSNRGRLSNTRSSITREKGTNSQWEIRIDDVASSKREQESRIHETTNGERIDRLSSADSRSSRDESGNFNSANGGERKNQRRIEDERFNEMDGLNEQLQNESRGDNRSRNDLQLDVWNEDSWQRHPYVVVDEKVNQILANAHLKVSNSEIRRYFELEQDRSKRADFLRNAFDNVYTGIFIVTELYGYKAFDNGVLFWKDNFLSRDTESFISWEDLTDYYDSMILLHQLNDKIKRLPSVKEQLSLLDENDKDLPELEFSQEFIDKYFQEEHPERKFYIYRQLQSSLSTTENINFIKDLYGLSGSTHTISGSGIGFDSNNKGITLYRGYLDNRLETLLKWNYVEKRLKELIKIDRYLNPKEKEEYLKWLDRKELEESAIEQEEIIPTEIEKSNPDYDYKIGDKVYIGADEFEIIAVDNDIVRLYDYQYPLFNQEMSFEEFDRKVKENPGNDYLQVGESSKQKIENQNFDKEKPKYKQYEYFLGDTVFIGEDECTITLLDNSQVNVYNKRFKQYEQIEKEQFDKEVKENLKNSHLKYNSAIKDELPDFLRNILILAKLEGIKFILNKNNEIQDVKLQDENKLSLQEFLVYMIDYFEKNSNLIKELENDRLYKELAKVREKNREYYIGKGIIYNNEPYTIIEINEQDDGDLAVLQNQNAPKKTTIEPIHFIEWLIKEKFQEIEVDLLPMAIDSIIFYNLDEADKVTLIDKNMQLPPKIELLKTKCNNFYHQFGFVFDEGDYDITDKGVEIQDYRYDSKVFYNWENFTKIFVKYISKNIKEEIDLETKESNDEKEILKIGNEDTIIPNFEKRKREKATTFGIHPEIKNEDRHNFHIIDDMLGVGNDREKFKRNINAIKVLKLCEKENRFATTEEQTILSKYVGWGGLSQAFEEKNSSWASEYLELKSILDDEEYKLARDSTRTSFYTPPIVIRTMYKALESMGMKDGNILEPACGIGNFLGMLPSTLKNCKLYGIEIDSISGRITRQLYQKSSIAVQGFEKTALPDSFFDGAIGNVPFDTNKLLDKRYDKNNFLTHDYFFAKTLDKVRPGGVIAFITSKGTLDKENPSVRRYIAQRADLLGAIRLPNNTFKDNAGTKVTSDIIFLQKRDSITDIEPNWVYLDTDENGIKMNSYFIDNPNMICGNMVMESAQFGIEPTCRAKEDTTLEEQLNNAILNIHAEIKEYVIDDIGEDEEDLSIPADCNVRNFSYTLVDDKIYYRENSRMYPQELPLTTENRVKGLIEIRECVRTLLELQTQDYPDYEIKDEQVKLNRLYDRFMKKYGLINSRANTSAFSNDSSFYLLCSLEILDENKELLRKADMFTKRTILPHKEITQVDTANEALIVSLSEKARVDILFMQNLCKIDMDKMLKDLEGQIFNVPIYGDPNIWVTADEYLSGNVREKLQVAREFAADDSRFNVNVKYLEEVQPEDLQPSEIAVRLGATWLPEYIIRDFIFYLLTPSENVKENVYVHYMEVTGQWNVEGKNYDRGNVKSYSTFGTNRMNAYKIIEETLNLKDVRIYDYTVDDEGRKVPELNKKETAIAQAKQEQIKTAFNEWIWNDLDRRERLSKIYNERFNCNRPREYDGSHINFHGMNPEITLRPHQINAIARILYGGNSLLAHEVGAGKTFEMVAAAMESKKLGLCNKSMFVVPNHIVEQFSSEFLQLYPSANILVTTKKDFETANRKKFCSRIATGDYDAVIISHSQFEKIPMSVERQRVILEKQIDDIIRGVEDLKASHAENFTIKQLVKTQKGLENKLEKLNDQSRKDSVVTFEELGVDRIFVDEAHYYKNLFLYTKMRNVGGIAQTEAQKSSDLFMKCRYLDELTGGKGIIFATGTPISNSMVELYTMQRYLQYAELEKRNLQHFDAWASTFGETVTAIELAPEGSGYRAKTRFAKFYNLPELMALFKEVADIQTADMLNLPVPKANYETIVAKPTEIQKEMVQKLSERAEKVRERQVDPTEDNMLKITNDGRKLALDQRLINDLLPDDPESKVSICANNIYRIWKEHEGEKLTQLVFCDLSTPNNDKFNIYNELKRKLQELGVPDDEVEFIHNANTDIQKKSLFSQIRNGIKRILLGSTQKMGSGTNCQDKLIAIHNLDCPWRPSDLTQRIGRIVRQGNKNKEVYIYNYVTEGTFDAYLYQLVENKQRFISQIMTSKTPVRFAEDIDETALNYAQIKALAAGNPLIIEKTELDTEVAKFKLLKQTHLSQMYAIEDRVIKFYPSEIKRLETRIEAFKNDIIKAKSNTTNSEEKFQSIMIKDVNYTDKAKAGEKIIELCKSITSSEKIDIGSYRGFQMELEYDSTFKNFHLYLKNELSHCVILGNDNLGNITRINNEIDGFPNDLKRIETELDDNKVQYENAKEEMKRPFKQEEELKEKSKRLDELNILLNMNEKDNEIIDFADDNEVNCQKSDKDYER